MDKMYKKDRHGQVLDFFAAFQNLRYIGRVAFLLQCRIRHPDGLAADSIVKR